MARKADTKSLLELLDLIWVQIDWFTLSVGRFFYNKYQCWPEASGLLTEFTFCLPADHVELVKRTMAAVALPSLGVPSWAREISEDQWKDMVQDTLQNRQSAAHLRIARRSNVPGP